jgi:hypothetical protein
MSAVDRGWKAEAFVRRTLVAEHPTAAVIDLAPAFACDLLVLDYVTHDVLWVEVKSSARAAPSDFRLSSDEANFRDWVVLHGWRHETWQLRRLRDGDYVIHTVVRYVNGVMTPRGTERETGGAKRRAEGVTA